MNYDRYFTYDVMNGEGLRLSLFVTGCAHACPGCHNRALWNRKTGMPFTEAVRDRLLDLCATHDGLTLSGGDPLLPANRDAITDLCARFKTRYPDKDIWMWTGYEFETVCSLPLMDYVDVIIDGPYKSELPNTLPWRGSDNQRLIRLHSKNADGLTPPALSPRIR